MVHLAFGDYRDQDNMFSHKSHLATFFIALQSALASITLEDPSDVISPSDWETDNALLVDYDIAFIEVQPIPSMSTHGTSSLTQKYQAVLVYKKMLSLDFPPLEDFSSIMLLTYKSGQSMLLFLSMES